MASNKLMTVFSVVLVMLVIAQTGLAIHCFVCNSHKNYDGEKCLEVTTANKTGPFYKNCEDEDGGTEFIRCRVQVQTVGDDNRVIRSCARKEVVQAAEGCVDRTGTSKIKLRYCECLGDGCNSATGLVASIATVLLTVAVACRLL